jgi:hypothetical protein
MSDAAETLRNSPSASQRAKAARTLGKLGPEARAVRGLLVYRMLNRNERNEEVRVAAADALKNVDPRMHYLAVDLLTEKNPFAIRALLDKVQALKEDAYPLSPIIADFIYRLSESQSAVVPRQQPFIEAAADLAVALTVLSHIATQNEPAYKLIASKLKNPADAVRHSAIEGLARMKHGASAVKTLIGMLNPRAEKPPNLIAVIETLVILAEPSTDEDIQKAINRAEVKYHTDKSVRSAVEKAENDLENKRRSYEEKRP